MSQVLDTSVSTSHLEGHRRLSGLYKWTVVIALFSSGATMMAYASFNLAYITNEEWHHGWIVRIVCSSLLLIIPAVIAFTVANFRSTTSDGDRRKRLTWAGISLLGFGAVEFVLGVAVWFLFLGLH